MANKLLPWPRSDWYETTWGELVELRYGKALQNYKEATSGFPVYGTNGPVGYNDKPLCEYPSVIVGRKGAYRGIHYSPTPFFVIDTAFYIEPRFDINLKWAYYELLQQDINGLDSGSAIPSTRREDFYALRVNVPPRDTQDQICKIPDLLNQKIALNRKINQTLEQMAQALFRSWFVDFDPVVDNALGAGFFEQDLEFPDELLRRAEARKAVRESADFKPLPDTILQLFPASFEECAESTFGLGGWVPRGWAVMPLDKVTSLIIDHRGKTPKKLGGDWSEKGHPAISAKNIKNGRLVRHDTIRCVDSDLYVKWMKDSLLASDILMTSEAPLGELLYLVKDSDYLLSQRLYGIRANKEIISGCYLYFWLQTNVAKADIDGRATGTTVVGIRQSELKKVNVMVPQKTVVDSFSNLAAHYLEKIESNEKQSTELESLRDILLPKLISGELRLDEFGADLAREKVA